MMNDNSNSYHSDRRVINVGNTKNNRHESQLVARIQQDFQEGGLLSRAVARTPRYDWRILFISDSEKIANKNEINRALLDVPSNLVGRAVWYDNQASLRVKNEQLGQIGLYPNNIEDKESKSAERCYQEIVSTAYHEAYHAEGGQKRLLILQNSLGEEFKAFRREELIKRSTNFDAISSRPSLKERATLFDEKVLAYYYEDVIAGNYSLGIIPKFIQQGNNRLPYEQKRPGKQGIDQRNFANITYHAFKLGKTKLLDRYGYKLEGSYDKDKGREKITVSRNNRHVITSNLKNGCINPQGSNVNLTEADILNSYQIARQIEAERVKQQDNTNNLSNFSTNNYTAQKPVDNRSFSSGVKQTIATGLLKARTSPASNRHLLNQKMLQRGKTKATDIKDPAQKTTSAFARYLPPKTKQTPPSTKELER